MYVCMQQQTNLVYIYVHTYTKCLICKHINIFIKFILVDFLIFKRTQHDLSLNYVDSTISIYRQDQELQDTSKEFGGKLLSMFFSVIYVSNTYICIYYKWLARSFLKLCSMQLVRKQNALVYISIHLKNTTIFG